KRGVWQAGGYPIELPAGAIAGETFTKPTAMLYRNLLSMETEELIRSYPVDGVVLMGGCDKTTPALLMGAVSAGVPAVFVPAGPILTADAYADAITTVIALGGSTNAVIHLIAMARRGGIPLSLDDFDAAARRVPVLANIKPGGAYLMEDFYYAGGLPAMLARLA